MKIDKSVAAVIAFFAAAALLTAYIFAVAYVKVDFISALPIIFACGLAPVLAAIGFIGCYGGGKIRRALCGFAATVFLCIAPLGFFASMGLNARGTVYVSVSPGGLRRMAAVRAESDIMWGHTVYPICPAWGLWYRQTALLRTDRPPVPEDFRWLDEHTVEVNIEHGGSDNLWRYDFLTKDWERAE